ncbi:MAG: alpha/beta hydrolase [Acidimicrobiia bacterium]|nr:alpha/beta hydrolase [Acidimicrobiia bacterium]
MTGRLRRTLLTVGAVVLFVALAGATYQGVATALERRRFPHPGRMLNVGGHQLHLDCEGDGAPVVVLEAPAGGMSAAWGRVQQRVARTTRVCSYDRAGLGWSEWGERPYDPLIVPEQLHALLVAAGEPMPYVLAGQELGAALATLYASQFGDDLAALVLVDERRSGEVTERRERATRLVDASPWLARSGLLRATRVFSRRAAGLPGDAAGALGAFLNRPDHLTRTSRELARWDDAVNGAAGAPLRAGLRVVHVDTGLREFQFLTNPAQADLVSAAIEEAVTASRAR